MTATAAQAANHLTARWAATHAAGSTALSGAGAWPLLALLAAAADGQARAELEAAVGRPADSADAGARDLLSTLSGSPTVRSALGVWARAELPVTAWWTGAVPAGVRGELSGNARHARAVLDAWAAERTGGLIEAMPVAVGPDTLMVLASALAVRTGWAEPFEDFPWRIVESPWARDGYVAGLTRTTSDTDALAVADTPAGKITLLAVRGTEDVDVHLMLGEAERAPGELLSAGIAALDDDQARVPGSRLHVGAEGPGIGVAEIPSFNPAPTLRVATVRFTVNGDHDLLANGPLFGLVAATDAGRGHFPGISPQPLAVSQARQGATATFTAEGFRAAAVTALGMQAGSAPPPHLVRSVWVAFDRPFGFAAVHRSTGLVLVAGWVAEPQEWPEVSW